VAIAAGAVWLAVASERAQAHKPITSKFSYNADVFPILPRSLRPLPHCGRPRRPCRSLTYKDSVRGPSRSAKELTAERMPPWYVDAESAAIKGGPSLSAREIDTIVTWATGGTPEGDLDKRPRPASVDREWAPGRPD